MNDTPNLPEKESLFTGEATELGEWQPVSVGDSLGSIPSSWRVRFYPKGENIAWAEATYWPHPDGGAKVHKFEIVGLGNLGTPAEFYDAEFVNQVGQYWADRLTKVASLKSEIPGGSISEVQERLRVMELMKVATLYAASPGKGFKAVSEGLNIPRQTAALRIQASRAAGFLPPTETPRQEVWGFVMTAIQEWEARQQGDVQ